MSVQNLIQKSVDAHNEKATAATETQVKQLVDAIISGEAQIATYQSQIVEYKKRLKALELPTPVKVEV